MRVHWNGRRSAQAENTDWKRTDKEASYHAEKIWGGYDGNTGNNGAEQNLDVLRRTANRGDESHGQVDKMVTGEDNESSCAERWRRGLITGVIDSVLFDKSKYFPLCQETQFRIASNCCDKIKKTPMRMYQSQTKRKPYLGTMAAESKLRENGWLKTGCNAFESKGTKQVSKPMSFWLEQDVYKYIMREGLEIASVYGEIVAEDDDGFTYPCIDGLCDGCKLTTSGAKRTGCIFCGFGLHMEKKGETRFQRLARTHPRQYEYCIGGGQWVDNPDYDPTAPAKDGDWTNWNPKKIWVPSKKGLGMGKVFDDCNQIYGKNFMRYE
jgi:hypothetical protein